VVEGQKNRNGGVWKRISNHLKGHDIEFIDMREYRDIELIRQPVHDGGSGQPTLFRIGAESTLNL